MDITQIDEEWYDIPYKHRGFPESITAVSNRGRILRLNGKIEYSEYNTRCRTENGEREKVCYTIARVFLVTVRRPDQQIIDHITHSPEYNINDVRNLRWCTQKENCGFEEHRINLRSAQSYDDERAKKISESVKRAFREGRIDIRGEKNGMYGKRGIVPWNKGKKMK